MAKLEDLGEIISTDVLIVGGGVGGLAAAIKAKEENPEISVLIVEKQTTGWAGKATKIGGILSFLGPDNNGEKFIEFQVRNSGFYLGDQELLTTYVYETPRAIQRFEEWGCKLARTPDGKPVIMGGSAWAPEWSATFIDIDMMLPMRAQAKKLGTRIMDKVHVVDLLKQGNRVVGAAGFNIIDGRFYIFKAKATILANGSCGYKVRRFWSAGTGDGVAAAYRAGAEMRNAEYGNLYGHTVFQETDSGMVGSAFLVNVLGENLPNKYLPDTGPSGVFLPVPPGFISSRPGLFFLCRFVTGNNIFAVFGSSHIFHLQIFLYIINVFKTRLIVFAATSAFEVNYRSIYPCFPERTMFQSGRNIDKGAFIDKMFFSAQDYFSLTT